MDVITYTEARGELKSVMDRVIHDREPVIVTRKKNEAVVMISLEEYNSINETLHLLRSPKNARRLRRAVEQLEAGSGTEREIDL
ncbi:MAG: type II toxin-antitoxin system prevent-host-death family antitoxin [Piscinibacter sp.]|nr:type II toxin-antitoxin system prevent-host-death family antitoxin [Piscinibacter sp.]